MTLRDEWLDYRRTVIPANAGEIQVRECKRAFYAGALSSFMIDLDVLKDELLYILTHDPDFLDRKEK